MISIVIPNYNGEKLLRKNLPKLISLLERSKLENEIIVVDDASTDNSISYLTTLTIQNSLKIIEKSKNEGFASTVDAGIRVAKGEIVFTMKTDAIPESSDYFRLMLEHFGPKKNRSLEKNDPSKNEVFAVSAALRTVEKGREEVRGQGVLIFFRGFFLHFRTHFDYVNWLQTMRTTRHDGGPSTCFANASLAQGTRASKEKNYSAWADGGAMAVRRDLYLKIRGFDKLYSPFYWEDTDLGYRAWKAGYVIEFEPKAILLHDFEFGSIANHYTKKQVNLISQRNQFIFVWKNGDLKHLIFHFSFFIFHFLVALKNLNWIYFRALVHAFLLLPRIFLARWRQRKVTKLSDDQALSQFKTLLN